MDEYLDVKIDVFEHTAQRARLRKTLTVGALIDEIFKEFDDVAADTTGKYALYLKGSDRPLPNAATLTQLDLQPQDELVFNYTRQANRQMLDPRSYAFLKDETTNRVYEIQWQPAIIGRPTNEAEHNIMLAVNLQLHPLGQTVSRTHAQIIFSKGSFFVEALAENNPLSVNGKPVPVNARREIKNGDRLILGRNNLSMTFNTQDLPAAPAAQARVQPAPQPVRQPPAPQAAAQPAPVIQPARQPAPAVEERTYVAPPAPASAPAGAASQPAHLVIERALTANKLGQRLDIPPGAFLLGRELPLLMGEGEISRRHAELNFDTRVNQYTITDLGSTNGVTLNGVRIDPNRPYSISNGTRIGLGANFLLRFEI